MDCGYVGVVFILKSMFFVGGVGGCMNRAQYTMNIVKPTEVNLRAKVYLNCV